MGYLNEKYISIFGLITCIILLCGCMEPQAVKAEFENITLQSTVVELSSAMLEKTNLKWEYPENEDPIQVPREVNVYYLFKNIVDRTISISVTVFFYDESDTLLATIPGQSVNNLGAGSTERMKNTVTYKGDDAALVDHVKIVAIEI